MAYRVDKDELERMVYELQQSKLPIERLAAELIVSRALVAELRRGGYLRPKVRLLLDRIPKLSDASAWVRLTDQEQQEAITDFMRENFE